MRIEKRDLKVVTVDKGFEETFWNYVRQDSINYYFFILDLKQRPELTKTFLALEGIKIQGLMLVFADFIVQLRGKRAAVARLLDSLNLEKVELQAPLECEDLVTRKYRPQIRHELVLMILNKGEERLQITHQTERLGPQDADEVAALMRRADPEWWGDTEAGDRRESLEKTYWVGIKRDGKIVSIGNTRFEQFGSNIGVIATDERCRNLGFATSIVSTLIGEILRRSPAALIHVLSSNKPALRVYSKVGYKPYKRYLLLRATRNVT